MSTADPCENLVAGYPKLSGYMGLLPQIAIFRTFSGLNAQNLLYLQAELTHLEKELRKAEKCDSLSTEGKRAIYRRDWFWLSESASSKCFESSNQWGLVLKIREVLRQYSM